MIIAVDGTAASGKGTIARRLAATLGLPHLDTGLLYRAVGMAVLRAGGDPGDAAAAERAARALGLDGSVLAGLAEDAELRSDAAGQAASRVAVHPGVRAALVDLQRGFAQQPGGAVLDGRDIGTVICPQARAKLWVDARLEVRALRRHKELLARGIPSIYDAVLRDMRDRDARDAQRAAAPMLRAPDAFALDTSDIDADQAYAAALAFVRSRSPAGQ